VIGGIRELAIPYLKDDPIGYVDVVCFLFRGRVPFKKKKRLVISGKGLFPVLPKKYSSTA